MRVNGARVSVSKGKRKTVVVMMVMMMMMVDQDYYSTEQLACPGEKPGERSS